MDLERERRELIEMINKIQDPQTLAHLKEVVEDLMSREEDFELSDEMQALLDERLASHRANPNAGSSWEEVKSRILAK